MRALPVALLLASCAAERALELEPELTHVLVSTDVAGTVTGVSILEAGRGRIAADELHFVLSFETPLERLLVEPSADGVIALDAKGLPLPRPKLARPLGGAGLEAPMDDSTLIALLDRARVVRPRCLADRARPVPLSAVPPFRAVSFVLAHGDGGLIGYRANFENVGGVPTRIMPEVYTLARDGAATRVSALALPADNPTAEPPLATRDGDESWVLFPRATTSSAVDYDLARVDASGSVVERIETELDASLRPSMVGETRLGPYLIRSITAARVGEGRRFFARGAPVIYVEDRFPPGIASHVALDERAGRWTPLEPRSSRERPCAIRTEQQLLAQSTDGKILGIRGNTSVQSFDPRDDRIAWSGAILGPEQICRSDYAALPDGTEIMTLFDESLSVHDVKLAWRFPGGGWQLRDEPFLDGNGLTSIAGGFAAAGRDGTIQIYQLSAARPELPPHGCGAATALKDRIEDIVTLADGRLLYGTQESMIAPSAGIIGFEE